MSPASPPVWHASDRTLRRHWFCKPLGAMFILGICGLFYLPGLFALPPVDRDEPRFAEATRRMLASGDWRDYIVPKIQDRARLNKPPLTYWLQAASVRLLRGATEPSSRLPTGGIWAYRIPSLIGALAAVLVTWQLGRRMFAGATAGWAALLLGMCGVVAFDVRQARTDEVLLALTTLAHLALWHIWSTHSRARPVRTGWVILFWLAIGLGAMTKSLVAPAVVGMTIVTLCLLTREWAWLRQLRFGWGILLLALIITPWVLLVKHQVGWQTLGWNIVRETFVRGAVAMEGHRGFPGFYLLLLPALFWPASLPLLPGLGRMLRRAMRLPSPAPGPKLRAVWNRWKNRQSGRPAELFCLAWLVGGWVFFEIARTKLPHYTLPLYPAAALVCARALLDTGSWRRVLASRLGRGALAGWLILTGILALILPISLLWLGTWRADIAQSALLITLLAFLTALFALLILRVRQRRFVAAQLVSVSIAALGYVTIFQLILPNLQALWLSSRIIARVQSVDPTSTRPLAAFGYHEDSLIYLTHGRAQRLDDEKLSNWLDEHPLGLAIVADPIPTPNLPCEQLGEESGFNYSNGQWQVLRLIHRAPEPGTPPAVAETAQSAEGAEPANRTDESQETPQPPASAGPGRP